MPSDRQYFAFISYSHADKAWGDWLHRAIETYRVPKKLVGRKETRSGEPVPARLFPVFRDREELPTSADLGTMLRQALDDSRYLVVICTPRSAQSRWVNEEVLHFKRSGRANRVLCLIADGEPNASAADKAGAGVALECFPPAVRHPLDAEGKLDFTRFEEPIAADARLQGDGKRAALLKLIAGLAEVGLDELRQRDHERARSIMLRWLAASAVLVLLLGGLAALALAEKKRAQQTLSSSDFYQADEWMRRGEPHASLLHLSRAVTTDPDNAAARLRLTCVLKQAAWPYETEEPTGPGEHAGVRDLLPVAGGRQVIVQTSQGYQQVWEAPGEALSPTLLHDEVEWAGQLSFVAVAHPGGSRMASGGHDGKVRRWKLPKGEIAAKPQDLGSQVIALAADAAGKGLAAGSDKGRVVWMDWDGDANVMMEGPAGRVKALALRADGSAMAAAIGDEPVRLWADVRSRPLELNHSATVNALAFSPDGRWLITGCHDGAVRVWDATSGKMHQEHKLASAVGCLAFSPTRATLAAGWGYYGDIWRVTLLSMLENGSLQVLHTVEHPLRDVGHRIGSSGFGGQAFSPDGERLLTWNAMDREVRCWSVNDGQMVMQPLLHAGPVGGAAFRGNDEILSGAADGLVRVWKWSSPAVPVTHALPAGYWIGGRWLAPCETWVGIARGEADQGILVIAKRTSEKWTSRQIVLPDLAGAFALTPEADSALLSLLGGGLVRVDLASGTLQKLAGWEGMKADFIECVDRTRFLIATTEGRLLRGQDGSATPDESFDLGDKVRTVRLDPSRRWMVAGMDLKNAWWVHPRFLDGALGPRRRFRK
jgi:WD40 repeat protein